VLPRTYHKESKSGMRWKTIDIPSEPVQCNLVCDNSKDA
jgi:hypothetical protein